MLTRPQAARRTRLPMPNHTSDSLNSASLLIAKLAPAPSRKFERASEPGTPAAGSFKAGYEERNGNCTDHHGKMGRIRPFCRASLLASPERLLRECVTLQNIGGEFPRTG